MKDWLMLGFGIFTVLNAAGVILSRSPVHSAFCLILSFFGLSGVFLLWGATFISMIQILIYTGAIVVLFVFVVMLLNLSKNSQEGSFNWITFGVTAVASFFFSHLLLRVLSIGTVPQNTGQMSGSIRAVSRLLFTRYLWPFEVLSVFLLVLIIAIFLLAKESEGSH